MVTRTNMDLPVWAPDERRPRQWLDLVISGADSLDSVPGHLSAFVAEHVRSAIEQNAHKVRAGLTLQDRIALLREVPPGIRGEVKNAVNRMLQDRR